MSVGANFQGYTLFLSVWTAFSASCYFVFLLHSFSVFSTSITLLLFDTIISISTVSSLFNMNSSTHLSKEPFPSTCHFGSIFRVFSKRGDCQSLSFPSTPCQSSRAMGILASQLVALIPSNSTNDDSLLRNLPSLLLFSLWHDSSSAAALSDNGHFLAISPYAKEDSHVGDLFANLLRDRVVLLPL